MRDGGGSHLGQFDIFKGETETETRDSETRNKSELEKSNIFTGIHGDALDARSRRDAVSVVGVGAGCVNPVDATGGEFRPAA
jgi:hypothetical protein